MFGRGSFAFPALILCGMILSLATGGVKADDVFDKAIENGRLANEGFWRCRLFVDGWLAEADKETGLIPPRVLIYCIY